MTGPEGVLISKIFAIHGSRPDLRIFRNETAGAYVGKKKGILKDGHLVLWAGWSFIEAGLCKGSADIIGLQMVPVSPTDWCGVLLALEVKTSNTLTSLEQTKFLKVVTDLGGIGAVVKSLEEVTAILGEPPKVWKAKV